MRKKLDLMFVDYIPQVFGLSSFMHWLTPTYGTFFDKFIIGCVIIYLLRYAKK